jgi:hypothetical protein
MAFQFPRDVPDDYASRVMFVVQTANGAFGQLMSAFWHGPRRSGFLTNAATGFRLAADAADTLARLVNPDMK